MIRSRCIWWWFCKLKVLYLEEGQFQLELNFFVLRLALCVPIFLVLQTEWQLGKWKCWLTFFDIYLIAHNLLIGDNLFHWCPNCKWNSYHLCKVCQINLLNKDQWQHHNVILIQIWRCCAAFNQFIKGWKLKIKFLKKITK